MKHNNKRRQSALWLLTALTVLTGCSSGGMSSSPSTVGSSVVENAVESEPIRYEVVARERSDSWTGDDGAELLHYSYELPQLQASREDGSVIEQASGAVEEKALRVTETFNEAFSGWSEEDFESVISMARQDYDIRGREDPDTWQSYDEKFTYQCYQTEELVSIQAVYWSYLGGAHGNGVILSWNFSLDEGSFFNPLSLAQDSQACSQAVTEELIRQAQARAERADTDPKSYYWEDYEDILSSWSSYAVSFDEEGMTVSFSPYELASYAAGAQTFLVDYSLLEPLLSEDGAELLGLNGE